MRDAVNLAPMEKPADILNDFCAFASGEELEKIAKQVVCNEMFCMRSIITLNSVGLKKTQLVYPHHVTDNTLNNFIGPHFDRKK